jgi:hypothetical protein
LEVEAGYQPTNHPTAVGDEAPQHPKKKSPKLHGGRSPMIVADTNNKGISISNVYSKKGAYIAAKTKYQSQCQTRILWIKEFLLH